MDNNNNTKDIVKIKKYINKVKKNLPVYFDIKLLLDTISEYGNNKKIFANKFYANESYYLWHIGGDIYSYGSFYYDSLNLNKHCLTTFSTFFDYSQFKINESAKFMNSKKIDDFIYDIAMQFMQSDVICLHTFKKYNNSNIELNNIKLREMFFGRNNNELDLSLCIKIMNAYLRKIYFMNNEVIKQEKLNINKNIEYYRLINCKNVPRELLEYYGEPYYSLKFRIRIPLKIKDIDINITENKKICVNANILFFPFLHKCILLSFVPNTLKKIYRYGYGRGSRNTYEYDDISIKLITSKYDYAHNLESTLKRMLVSYSEFIIANIKENIKCIFDDQIYIEEDNEELTLSYVDPMVIAIGNLFDNNNIIRIHTDSNYTLYFPYEYGKYSIPILIDNLSDIKDIKYDYIDSKEKNGTSELFYLPSEIKNYKHEFYSQAIDAIKNSKKKKDNEFFTKHEEIRKWIIDTINEKFNKGKKYRFDYQAFKIFVIKYDLNGVTFSLNLPLSRRLFNSDYDTNANEYYCTPYRCLYEEDIDKKDIFAKVRIYFNNNSRPQIKINSLYLEENCIKGNELDSLLTFFVVHNENLSIVNENYEELSNKDERCYLCKEYLKFLYTNIVNNKQFLNYLREMVDILKDIVSNDKASAETLNLINSKREKFKNIDVGIGKNLLNDEINETSINDYDNIIDYFIETMFYIGNDDYIVKKIKIYD